MLRSMRLAVLALTCLAVVSAAMGQGIIVPPRPPRPIPPHPPREPEVQWAIKSQHVKITVRDQVASVTSTQELVNTSSGMVEVEYLVPIGPDAALDNLTLSVDGKDFKAQLLKADEARKIYEEIVRRRKDPALLEYAGYGLLKTSAFPLEPGKPAKIIIHYDMVAPRDGDLVELWHPLRAGKNSAKAIEEIKVIADIKADQDITSVYSPSHELVLERHDARHVVASWSAKDALPTADFQLLYRLSNKDVSATFLTHQPSAGRDGYFLMLVSPNPSAGRVKAVAKDVVLVLDRSGSMGGEKIEQARDAARYILKNLNAEDRFNVIAYHDGVDPFYDTLVDYSDKRLEDALDRVDRIEAGGGTALHKALTTAMEMCKKGERPTYVIFLTDGLPTIGTTDEGEIIKDTTKANDCNARLFAFGVGYNVNVRLLDNLVRKNNGRSDYVKPKEDVEAKVSSLYRKIRNPVMTNVAVKVTDLDLRDMYPREIGDLFEGDQLVLVGRYDALGKGEKLDAQVVVTGKYMGKERGFEYPVTIEPGDKDDRHAYVERLWAMRRIGYLLDQVQLAGETQEVTDEIIKLSKEYGIMTPYTSFLAREDVKLGVDNGEVREEFEQRAGRLQSEIRGQGGQVAAKNRQALNESTRAAEPAAAPAPASGPGSMGIAADSASVVGYSSGESYEKDKTERVANVRQVGNQTLYKRDKGWITPQAAARIEKDKAEVQEIERFSDEYFALVNKNTVEQNRVLASQRADEELVVELRGQVYRIR